jgi:N-hydroxyarylamine O-acetyltransferase
MTEADRLSAVSPATTLDISKYLDRIGYSGPTALSAQLLHDLHRRHMLSVPFENLDILLGRRIVCDQSAFVEKIVERRRGGFCYELNGAFSALLRALGFAVTMLSARVTRDDGQSGPEFAHLVLRVDLDEPWLCDVGFGDSFVEPLCLQPGVEQPQGKRTFRLVKDGRVLHLELREPDTQHWERQYSFTLVPRRLDEFASMCEYHQTSPDSHFTRATVCSLATSDGRITLTDQDLMTTRDGERVSIPVISQAQRTAVLRDTFGIEL